MSNIRFNEFAVGKADAVAEKIFSILARRTGMSFKVKNKMTPYKNRWGSFLGKYAAAPNGMFRLNFIRGKSDEAVSLDYWGKGKNPYKPPDRIFSFEGFGITKLYFQIEDFIKGKLKDNYKESVTEFDLREYRLAEETVKDLFILYATDNPTIIATIAKGGYSDEDMYQKVSMYAKQKGIKVAGFARGTLAPTIKSYLKKIAKGQEPAIAGVSSSLAAQAANATPAGKVLPGSASGAMILGNTDEVLSPGVAKTVNKLTDELNEETGAFGVIRKFEKHILVAATNPVGARVVIACGRAGTGKTHTAKKFLEQNLGLSYGAGYIEPANISFSEPNDVTALFCKYFDTPFMLFDDADQLFISRSDKITNLMKKITDPKRANRTLTIEKNLNSDLGKINEGSYTIDCKLIWCTNKKVNEIDAALLTRTESPCSFDFTDQEIMDLIKSKLTDLYDEYPELTKDEIFTMYMYFQDVVNKLAKQPGYDICSNTEINFRKYTAALEKMVGLKLANLPIGEVYADLNKVFGITKKSPAQVIANI